MFLITFYLYVKALAHFFEAEVENLGKFPTSFSLNKKKKKSTELAKQSTVLQLLITVNLMKIKNRIFTDCYIGQPSNFNV